MAKRYIKKQYGEYRVPYCPFCGKIATQKNEQGLEVCRLHTKTVMPEFKCACGSWLETRAGKYGPYFYCLKCGNVNYKKGLEMKAMHQNLPQGIKKEGKKEVREKEEEKKEKPKEAKPFNPYEKYKRKYSEYNKTEGRETTITTDDVEYFS